MIHFFPRGKSIPPLSHPFISMFCSVARAKMHGFDDRGSHGGDVINIHPEDHLFPYIALWQGCYHRRRCYHSSCRSFFIGPVRGPVDAAAILLVETRRRLGVSHTLKPDVNPITGPEECV